MDDRGGRAVRGMVTAGLCTLLIATGHVLGGGAVPDLALLVVLFPLLTGAVVGVADRCRSVAATLATLAGGQYALHVLLGLLHPHEPATRLSPWTMLAVHAALTVVVAVLLRHADGALTAVGTALLRALRRPSFVPATDTRPALRVAGPARPGRRRALAAVPALRGPPVGC